jgi:Domain of unknown function (DUF397)
MAAQDIDLSRAVWRKSARSNNGGACVEVADLGTAVAVRDSMDPDGPKLILTPDEWRMFARSVRSGFHDT